MHTTKWCHWYNFQVFDAPVTHSWQVRSHKPAYHQHIEDDWLYDCRKSTWRLLCMKWRALGPAQSIAGRCRWLISVLTSHHWHRRSESGQTSKMKTNPLQALDADQGQLAVWSGRPYQMPNLNPVVQARTRSLYTQSIAVSVEWPRRYEDCLVGNKWLSSACRTNLDATMCSTTLEVKERFEIGLYDVRWSRSRVLFFSWGSTMACFWLAGKMAQRRVALHRLQITGTRTSCIFLTIHAGTGPRK